MGVVLLPHCVQVVFVESSGCFYGRPLDTANNQSEERHQLILKFDDAVLIE